MPAHTGTNSETLAPDGAPISRRLILAWEAGIFLWVTVAASALHYAYELSGFALWITPFAAVNESSIEHLKLFFWPALIAAFVQHAYARQRVNNFWWAKAMAMIALPFFVLLSFYAYVVIVLPIHGKGTLWGAIGTGAIGVLAGNVVAYRIMTAPPLGRAREAIGLALIGLLGVHYVTVTHLTPRHFLYEDFLGYTYSGQFGILEDYTDRLVFVRPEANETLEEAE